LQRHQRLHIPRTPAGLLLDLPRGSDSWIFIGVDVSASQLPHPAVDDEAVPPQHQYVLLLVIEHDHHGCLGHPEDVLLKLHTIWQLHRRDAQLQPTGVVNQSLAVDLPQCGFCTTISCHATTVPTRIRSFLRTNPSRSAVTYARGRTRETAV
jgi:hypothetical protein